MLEEGEGGGGGGCSLSPGSLRVRNEEKHEGPEERPWRGGETTASQEGPQQQGGGRGRDQKQAQE